MQGNNSLMLRLKTSNSLVEVNTEKQKDHDDNQNCYVERSIRYSVGKRFLSFNIIKVCKGDRVNLVLIQLKEESVKGSSSSVNLNMRFVRNDRYGVMCSMDNALSGSYEMRKKNYCVPPMPEIEVTVYSCRETGDRSCLTLEKKKSNGGIAVERVKVTHSFVVGNETLSVKVKITKDVSVGLRVDVEGPVKLKMDYSKHVFGKIEKMESEMVASAATLFDDDRTVMVMEQVASNQKICIMEFSTE